MSLALSGTQQDVARPLATPSGFDRVVLVGGQANLHDDGAPLIFGERWPSGARVHAFRIAGHGKLCKRVDTMTYAGHNTQTAREAQ